MTYFLLRHGAYDEGNECLNERGITQTNIAFELLKNENISIVLHSNGPRSKQTAEILAKKFLIESKQVDWLQKNTFNFDTCVTNISIAEDSNHIALLITSGEYIVRYITKLCLKHNMINSLRPLVKGDMFVCQVGQNIVNTHYIDES